MNIVSLTRKEKVTITVFDLNVITRLALKKRDMTF